MTLMNWRLETWGRSSPSQPRGWDEVEKDWRRLHTPLSLAAEAQHHLIGSMLFFWLFEKFIFKDMESRNSGS